jgi:YidC/Oxa1 family membrane protein insertase
MEDQQKNLFIAIALTVLIMIGYQLFVMPLFEKPKPPAPVQTQTAPSTTAPAPAPTATPGSAPAVPGAAPSAPAAAPKSRAEVLAASPRIRIDTPKLHGSIALVGGRLDDLELAAYHETIDPKSPEIVLLSPPGTQDPYFIDAGWSAADKAVAVPGDETRWTAKSEGALTPTHPVELTWDNGQGLTFTRRIAVDENYLFTVTQSVANRGEAAVSLYPYGFIWREDSRRSRAATCCTRARSGSSTGR